MSEILIVGIATVDAIARPIDEFPSPGGLFFFDQLTFATGGCAVNCSIALAKLGAACDVVTRVGHDVLGDFVLAELERNRVPTAGVVRDPDASTAFTFAAVGSDGERRFLHTVGANATICRADVRTEHLARGGIVFVAGTMLMDTLDGPQTAALLSDARSIGATTLLDTVYVESAAVDEWRRRVSPALSELDYFIPSYAEARALTGLDGPPEIAGALQADGAQNIVVKLGSRGVFCRDASGHETHVPAFKVDDVVDTTGAGDCWSAGFLLGLQSALPIHEAARLGNAVAAYGIQAPGAATGVKSLETVREFMRGALLSRES
jgi:sugar/nucleoside kinase (ribokinase family)